MGKTTFSNLFNACILRLSVYKVYSVYSVYKDSQYTLSNKATKQQQGPQMYYLTLAKICSSFWILLGWRSSSLVWHLRLCLGGLYPPLGFPFHLSYLCFQSSSSLDLSSLHSVTLAFSSQMNFAFCRWRMLAGLSARWVISSLSLVPKLLLIVLSLAKAFYFFL